MTDPIAPSASIPTALEPEYRELLTSEAQGFIAHLQRKFRPLFKKFSGEHNARLAAFKQGERPDFLAQTAKIRESHWTIGPGPIPKALQDRRVELVVSSERDALETALASGAQVVTATMENDGPTDWRTVMKGHINLRDVLTGVIGREPVRDKDGRGGKGRPTVVFQPRGWHRMEENFTVDGSPVHASLFDFGLFFFVNQDRFIGEHRGCFLHLPELYGHRDALLWNEVFVYAQDTCALPRGKISVTAAIETMTAAFEMDEILYDLREHVTGLSCGYQGYIASLSKTLPDDTANPAPRAEQDVKTAPCLRSLSQLLVKTCHRRGAYAIGGLTAGVPEADDEAGNKDIFAQVRTEKEQEAEDGFDGSRVGHPDLVPVVRDVFDRHMGQALKLHDDRIRIVPGAHDVFAETEQGPNQLGIMREDVQVTAEDLLAVR